MESCLLKFWGVRGSIPTPGKTTIRYGGNTPCIELQFANGPHFILDAGTGIRELGKKMMDENSDQHSYIFISHFHWDHIQGLPFFRPAFDEKNKLIILGADDVAIELPDIISFQMDPKYFPISSEDMKANLEFRSIQEEQFTIEGVDIKTIYLNHPGYALGFRFSYMNKNIVYISDNEPFHTNGIKSHHDFNQLDNLKLDEVFDKFIENKEEKLISFCSKADVLIHDSQFLPKEYKEKKMWGHSPFNYAVELALKSDSKLLVLFHHDPDHDDETIDRILKLSQKLINASDSDIKCLAAQEGLSINV
jgi:phosphoribosyl 1,2-cyclic phosphodiesterase